MSNYTSFAVVGAGTFGMPIVKALVAQNASVVLLSRNGLDEKKSAALPAGAKVATVDTADAAAVAAVLAEHKVEVLISTITTAAVGAQTVLVDAAKSAGLKLFVPSEFGMTTEGQPGNPKSKIIEYTKTAGVPYARFFIGMLTEFIPFLVGLSDGKIRIVGTGEAPVSFTSVVDVAGFAAHVLTTLPPNELANRTFRLQGDRSTLNQLGPIFNNAEVEHTDKIAGPMGEMKTMLMTIADTGVGSTGWDAEKKAEKEGGEAAGSSNSLWAGHQWRSIKDVHNL
ncbi:hypothetical protein C8R46DRAFT_281007 [Mycena filopes]|nr:hypothetical protein C8R46DRAFT_281007 [Mycena filopes]